MKTQNQKTQNQKRQSSRFKNATAKPEVTSCFQIIEHNLVRAGRRLKVIEAVFANLESRNTLSLNAARDLKKLVSIARHSDGLLIRAEGRVFCAGGNIKDHIQMGKAASLKGNREITLACESLSTLDVPTIAVVEGDVIGGGVEFLSCFDVVIATPHVMIGFWQRRLGLTYGWGGGARLERRIGRHAVARLAIEACALTGREACRLGLIDRVVAPWQVRSEGIAELLRVAALPGKPVAILKTHSRRSGSGPESRSGFEKLWFGADHLGRMNAFAHGR